MNTASRMESTGKRGHIQVSQETADLLVVAGRGDWVPPREEKVIAKGKGEMQTYWLEVGSSKRYGVARSDSGVSSSGGGSQLLDASDRESLDMAATQREYQTVNDKTTRLIKWNVDVLMRLLKQVEARRISSETKVEQLSDHFQDPDQTVLDEVKEIIELPTFNTDVDEIKDEDIDLIDLGADVQEQVHDYVSAIASMYRENPFHNFEHASHVTMSVVKLLSRIVAPVESNFEAANELSGSMPNRRNSAQRHSFPCNGPLAWSFL